MIFVLAYLRNLQWKKIGQRFLECGFCWTARLFRYLNYLLPGRNAFVHETFRFLEFRGFQRFSIKLYGKLYGLLRKWNAFLTRRVDNYIPLRNASIDF